MEVVTKYTAGHVVAEILAAEGVDRAFGIPDGTYQGLISGLDASGIRLVTPRHETTNLHMAGAFARLTGRLGVAIASNGPGVANALPGIAVEEAEGNRVLLVTSSRRSGITYPDRGGTYQHFDQVAVIGPMAKWSASAATADRVPELLRTALRESFTGRPGVVHLDIPESVFNNKTKQPSLPAPSSYRATTPLEPSAADVKAAADTLLEAQVPMIHAGGGVLHAQAYEQLQQLADLLQAPVTTSWSGVGAAVHTSPLVWPIAAIESNNEVRNRADVVLALGVRFGETDWWGKAPNWSANQKVIHVDIDESAIGRNKPAHIRVLADAGAFLSKLIEELEGRGLHTSAPSDVVSKLIASKKDWAKKLEKHLEDMSDPMASAHIPHIAREVFEDDAILIADGGNTAVWTAFYWEIREPGTSLGTPHFGHLGAGVGQALGAAEAYPDRQVCCIIGDGAFGMHPQEVETAVRNGYRIVFIVVSDRQWGMVKMSQSVARKPLKMMVRKSLDPEETTGTDLAEIGYDAMARSMGGHGERVSDPTQLADAIKRSLDTGTTSVIHVDVDPTKHLWAPGLLHFKKMHEEPAG